MAQLFECVAAQRDCFVIEPRVATESLTPGGGKMKAVGYIRVSSEMQAKQGHSLDTQRQLARRVTFVRSGFSHAVDLNHLRGTAYGKY